jgi:hypothetical protein
MMFELLDRCVLGYVKPEISNTGIFKMLAGF